MNGTGRKSEPPKKDNEKSKKPEKLPAEDDDYEDGDIATPKQDRHGDDDEHAGSEELPVAVDTRECETGVEHADDDGAEHGADDGRAAPEQRGAADHHGGDAVKRHRFKRDR